MTLQDLGSVGEFVAALATIVTLVYLAIQIRHNTRASKEDATRRLVLANSDATMEMVRDEKLTEVVGKGFLGEDLAFTDQLRFNGFLFSYYNQVDYAYERFREGTLDERSWNKIAKEIPIYIGSPGGIKWWARDKVRFSPEFVSYVDGALAKKPKHPFMPTVPPSPPNKV